MLSSQLFFKDAAWRRRIDDFILLDDDDDDGNERVVGLVGWLEHEHDACEEEDDVRWQSIGAIVVPKLLRDIKKFWGISFFVKENERKGKRTEKERKRQCGMS